MGTAQENIYMATLIDLCLPAEIILIRVFHYSNTIKNKAWPNIRTISYGLKATACDESWLSEEESQSVLKYKH